jgi:hypothetical protein
MPSFLLIDGQLSREKGGWYETFFMQGMAWLMFYNFFIDGHMIFGSSGYKKLNRPLFICLVVNLTNMILYEHLI